MTYMLHKFCNILPLLVFINESVLRDVQAEAEETVDDRNVNN
jgi:hypothetical protein